MTIADDDITLTAVVTKGHWITFDSKGGTYVAPQFVTGTTQKPADPTRAGYTFDGWQLNGVAFAFGGTLTDNIALEAAWTANTDTRYTVIHWQENANDNEYSFKESETKTGTTGGQTSASAKSYRGFTAQTVEQKTIAGDGSTIVNVYYKRNVYEVKFYSYTPSQEYTSLRITAKYGAYNSRESFKYGERTVWALNADIEAATAEGYITLLEFDADTRSLYVTAYSPVKNDFVYDNDKLGYEQFTLYNAF